MHVHRRDRGEDTGKVTEKEKQREAKEEFTLIDMVQKYMRK